MTADAALDLPTPDATLNRARVTGPDAPFSLFDVGTTGTARTSNWPVERFNTYLRKLMDANGIADFAVLSRLTGVTQTALSNWRRGLGRPSFEGLAQIAPTLRVKPVLLWLQAGLVSPSDLDLSAEPRFDVLPAEVRQLAETLDALAEEDRRALLDAVGMLVAGYRGRQRKSKPPR